MTLLKLKNLSLTIQDKPILKSINLEIKNGEVYGLLGESGCGKSMTAAAITQLLPKFSKLGGKVSFDNNNFIGKSDLEMCKIRGNQIAMIFQEPMTALNPLQTIGNQIAESLLIHKKCSPAKAIKKAGEALGRVGLDATKISPNLYPHQLSGGQRQRVMIAMAIILRPKLLIADEPTTALDVKTQSEILNLLQDLVTKDKVSLLLITHDIAVIAKLATKVAIMKDGELLDSGSTSTVFERLSHPYTRQILSDSIPQKLNLSLINTKKLLEVKSVSKTYQRKFGVNIFNKFNLPILKNISFSINDGECLGLVGESGCGKSTLARSILGLETLESGSITLSGFPISLNQKTKRNVRSRIQIVFQDPFSSFNPRHQIAKIISEPFNLLDKKLDKKIKTNLLLETILNVGLTKDDLIKYPHQFSGGQRQRIALARAIIIKPKLIILDEALSALDVSLRNNMILLLQKLSLNYKLSYLFISHDIHLVKAITNRVLIMQEGTIVEFGKTQEILNGPKHPYTRSLIDSTPSIPESWFKRLEDQNIA
ncbi:MAG: ABC transporter ATP-binding protein [Paracoccaceae bacterium]|nr:ABC transporter ATP-binding protein [Paracoccaceae bacterium]